MKPRTSSFKAFLMLAQSTMATVLLAGNAHAQITNNLLAYWNFEGNTNNNVIASGGSTYNGVLSGDATTTGATPKSGTAALKLDGTGDFMTVNSLLNLNQSWTISAWLKSSAAPLGSERQFVFESYLSTAANTGYGISYGLREGTPTTNTNFQTFTDLTGTDLSDDTQIPDSAATNWHHILLTYTAGGNLVGYLNGVQDANIVIPNGTFVSADRLRIGTFRSANARFFNGSIDEVALWNANTPAADAYWIYNLGDKGLPVSTGFQIKADNLTALGIGSSWVSTNAPTAADYITFDSSYTQAGALDTSSDLSVSGLRVTGTGDLININNTSGFLEIGTLGLDMSGATRDLIIENLRISDGQRWNIAMGQNFTIGASTSLSGAHAIQKTGAGTAIMLGDNAAFSGNFTITAGTLQVGDGTTTGSLGTGTITNNARLVFDRSNETTVSNLITGTGNLFQDGTGTLVLTNANTFSGTTDILSGGTLRLDNALALQNSTLITEGVVFDASVATKVFTLGGLGGSGLISLENNATTPEAIDLRIGNNNANSTFTGTLGGSGSLTKIGTGTLSLNSASSYTGGTTIESRRLHVGNNGALGTGAITVGVNTSYAATYTSGGAPFLAMTSTSAATLANDIILPDPASTSYYALQKLAASSTTGTNLELSGTISGGGANMILQLDSATAGDATTSFTLSGTNTLSGQIRLNRGAVILTNAASLGSATLFVQSNGNTTDGNVRFTNSFTLANNITIGVNTNNSFNTGENDVVLSGILSGTGNWGKVGGSGKLTLTNTNTATGAITLSSGTLAIGTGSSLFSTGAFFGAGGTTYVTVNTGATLETRNWGYGAGNALNELRANSASVRVNGGTIRFTETQSALRGFQVGPAGAALEAIADVTFTKLAGTVLSDNIIQGVTSAGSLTLTGAGNGVIEDGIGSYGSWSTSAGIIKSGSGTWTLSGTNTFTGNTTVNAGTLRLASPAGRLTFALTGVSNNSVSGDGTAQFDAEFFLNLAAADLTDGNTWTLVNMANATYEDDFTVNSSLGAFTRTGTLHTLTEGENTWVFDEEEGTLTLNPPSGTTYASWIAGFFPDDTTNPAIVGPNADPDKDGVSNALELVFGGNPKNTMDADLMPKIALVTNPGGTVPDGDYLRLTYRRSSASTTAGITTIAEYDSDLNAPWTSATDGVDGVVIITTENGFAAGIDKVETFIPRGSLSTIFGRVKATVP